jgi:hypothetical protein
VQVHGLSVAQVAAVRFHGSWDTVPARSLASCPWLLVDVDATASLPATVTMAHWRLVKRCTARRPRMRTCWSTGAWADLDQNDEMTHRWRDDG